MPVISIPFRTRQLVTAEDAVNEFTRRRMREDGFFRQLLPPVPISNDELNQPAPLQLHDESAPAAIAIPLATLPAETFIRGPAYRVRMVPIHAHAASPERSAEVAQ
ncbi:MAG: hypothetical protein E6R03_04490 [Hyphomicrobiaceae bacterium]|nr:MAG: hypothetical protein E6R03_04490 [Hyphomicrobiaceae bacterium]